MADDKHRHYKAHGAAAELWRDRSPEVMLSGPAGTGKSRANLEKLHACLLRWPGARALIVRKTRESLSETALVTFEAKVLPEGSPIKEGAQRRVRQVYSYPNGSTIVVGGMDKATKIMSTEYDLIYAQEAIELTENDWESLTTRLRNGVIPFQQIIGDTNPDAPTHWLKRRADSGAVRMLESRHEDNPALWTGSDWTDAGRKYIAKLDALTGVRKLRLRHGKWAAAEGMVYSEWDRSVHLIDRFPIPDDWQRVRSIDFGYTNPFVCQWWAVDPDKRVYLYREYYQTQRIVADHAKEIERLSGNERYIMTVADHDAGDRATLRSVGIYTKAAKKAVKTGIEAVQSRLRMQPDGKARLFVMRDCLVHRDADLVEAKKPIGLAEEIDGYVWATGTDNRAAKEEPVKLNDHAMDAARYAVMAIDTYQPIEILTL
jgi:phage terminase large subunit